MSRSDVQLHTAACRRLGPCSGRRFAWILAFLLVTISAGIPATALADPSQTVVQATIYPHSGGGVSSQAVTLATLEGCPLYSGSSPMYTYPGDQPYSPAVASAWSLATVVSCGLRLPLSGVTDVQIDNPPHGFEASLTSAQLSDPSQWHDPNAPDALPVVSVDGAEDQTIYTRPWLGGSDANATDQVVSNGPPVNIVVYDNGPPLRVAASSHTISQSSTIMKAQLDATVENPDGTPVPSTELTWSWSFGDGSSSTESSPQHSFAPGVYPVTVQVSDNANGTGGTDNVTVTFNPTPASGSGPAGGAGRNPHSRSPTGPVSGSGTHPGSAAGNARGRGPTSNNGHSGGARSAAGTGSAAPATRSASAKDGSAGPASSASRLQTRSATTATASRRSSTLSRPPTANLPVVAGRLISDVIPVPADASPLVERVSSAVARAPAVRAAESASPLPAIGAGLTLALLFGLGAAREIGGASVVARLRRLI